MSKENERDPQAEEREQGAIYGSTSGDVQADPWQAEKTDLLNKKDPPHPESLRGGAGGRVHAQPPEEFTGLEVTEVEKTAAGLPAVRESFRYAIEEMGPVDGLQMLRKINQTDGFDCAGCAWPDPPPGMRSFAEFCENGAKASAEENTRKRVTPEFFREHSVAELSGRSDFWLAKQGRISQPMVLREGATHYEPIGWDEAFRMIADELNALESPDEAIFYTSGRTSNETAFLYQLFIRQFGTNNLPDCSNMCHESSGTALTDTIGIGKGTVTLEDVLHTDLLISIGQNPGSCHPRMLTALQTSKQNGANIIAVNPLPETGLNHFKHPQDLKNPLRVLNVLTGDGTQISDLFVPVRINGDVALLKGVMKEMLAAEERRPGTVFDHDFIREHTSGFEDFIEELRAEDWDVIVEQSGISREQIREMAEMVMANERIIISWAMGLTQHKNAVGTIQECVNLLLLKGSIGKPGAGALPVRGHSNVQGDRTMGIWERPRPEFLDALAKEFGFEPPRHHGFDTVESIEAMHEGKAKVFIAMGGNFLSATPDTEYTAEALRRCRLTAQISLKLNRSHLVTGTQALILPTLGRSERDVQASGPQFVTVENSMGVIHSSRGNQDPASEHLISEPVIVAKLARRALGDRSTVDWEGLVADYDRIRDHIERVIPGFDDFNRRVREPGGFPLPNLPRDRREFKTRTGKANFTVHPIPRHTLEPGQLVMMSVRSHDQFNTTVYGLNDRYRGIRNERRVVMMNPEDITEQGLAPGQVVNLVSHFEGEERVARRFIVVSFPIPRKCAATYFPETNVLVPIRSVAEKSNTPTSKFVIITVEPSANTAAFDYDHVEAAQAVRA
jgi:molybdopterin-dependent oxidoreductase alpha subunit